MSLLRSIVSVVLLMQIAFHTFAKSNMEALHILHAKDVDWGYLNPLRGDKSPGAANLWGNRSFNSATGMLVRFNKGFSSPPHIHNISYRGIVLEGLMHNDEPSAPEKWLSKGSFWTQPAGHVHITAANGETKSNKAYLLSLPKGSKDVLVNLEEAFIA
jgi:quercetin dioxygenase-like cupin family protein